MKSGILHTAANGRHCEANAVRGYPRLPAWQALCGGGWQTVIWCRYCRRYHLHGAGRFGHRVAHCDPGSPYYEFGYVLVDAGQAPADIAADLQRQRSGYGFKRRTAAAESFAVDARGEIISVTPGPRPEHAKRVRR
jgi:hypothetical protein